MSFIQKLHSTVFLEKAATLAKCLGVASIRNCNMLLQLCAADKNVQLELPEDDYRFAEQPWSNPSGKDDALLILAEQGAPTVLHNVNNLYDFVTVTYASANEATIAYGSKCTTVPVYIVSADNITRLVVSWPAEVGMLGDIQLLNGWSVGTSFQFIANARYDVHGVAKQLLQDNDCLDLFIEVDLIDAIRQATTESEVVALAALALYKHSCL